MNPTFTDEQHAARWLARFALPFVNATPDQLREAAFTAYAQNVGKQPCRCDGTDEPFKKFNFERYDIYKKVSNEELLTLQGLIRTMLYIVLSDKKYEELPKDIKRRVKGIEKTIKTVFTRIKWFYEWKGKGQASVLREGKNEDGVILSLEEWFIQAITMCLYSQSLSDVVEPIKGEGFDKLGMCPVCGIFFEKIRKNKEYCSDNCAEAARMRRVRRKNK